MESNRVLPFTQWLALFRAHLEADYDVEVFKPMYHEMAMYRKLYDLGKSPYEAARRLMQSDDYAVLIPAS